LSLYKIAIHKFLGNSIIKKLEKTLFKSNQEIREQLKPKTNIGLGDWMDLAGLIAPQTEIDSLLNAIEKGQIKTLLEINNAFKTMHENYYEYEWTWAWDKIQKFYQLTLETITAQDILSIIDKWEASVLSLDEMIYNDAKKEFTLSYKTRSTADEYIQMENIDFKCFNDTLNQNPFVISTLKHMIDKKELGEDLRKRIKHIK